MIWAGRKIKIVFFHHWLKRFLQFQEETGELFYPCPTNALLTHSEKKNDKMVEYSPSSASKHWFPPSHHVNKRLKFYFHQRKRPNLIHHLDLPGFRNVRKQSKKSLYVWIWEIFGQTSIKVIQFFSAGLSKSISTRRLFGAFRFVWKTTFEPIFVTY